MKERTLEACCILHLDEYRRILNKIILLITILERVRVAQYLAADDDLAALMLEYRPHGVAVVLASAQYRGTEAERAAVRVRHDVRRHGLYLHRRQHAPAHAPGETHMP
jgi:hypothetical protein